MNLQFYVRYALFLLVFTDVMCMQCYPAEENCEDTTSTSKLKFKCLGTYLPLVDWTSTVYL